MVRAAPAPDETPRASRALAPSTLAQDTILVVDSEGSAETIGAWLTADGHSVRIATSPEAAILQCHTALVMVLGAHAPGTVLASVRHFRPDLPVVVVGMNSTAAAVAALRAGACDFVVAPPMQEDVVARVRIAADVGRAAHAGERIVSIAEGAPLVGSSACMARIHALTGRIATSDLSVLILGETGTGKELVARAIHDASPRTAGPFVAINCSAVPATLLESELFGHVRGAFTDAKTARRGLFSQASGGTLFLDEIGDLPLELQPKLLRVLQSRTVRPVGSNDDLPFNTRIICASHRNLEAMASAGEFRLDLFYRLNVVTVALPPLRDRGADILELATFFLERAAHRDGNPALALDADVVSRLLGYPWPGNVRELENCIERAVVLARRPHVTMEDLPERVRMAFGADRDLPADIEQVSTLAEVERRYIERALRLAGGNKSRAAAQLGLSRRTLYRRLSELSVGHAGPKP